MRPSTQAQLGGVEIVDHLADEWRALCDVEPSGQPFYRPEWIAAYARAFAPTKRLLVITSRVAGRLTAVVPLESERGFLCGLPIERLQSITNTHRFDIVRAPGPEGDAAILELWCFLKSFPGWDLIKLARVPRGAALEEFAQVAESDGFHVESRESLRSPYISIVEWTGVDLLWPSHISAEFRRDLSRQMRKLAAQGQVLLRRVEKVNGEVLQQFYELERSGWKGKEGSAIACKSNTRQFYDEIGKEAGRLGYLSLYFLDFGGRTIAGHFGITYRGRYYCPKVAYDEEFKQYGPGQLLMNAVLRDCVGRKLSEVDILGSCDWWKTRWTPWVRPHRDWYIFNKRAYAQVLHSLRFRVAPAIRRRLAWLHSAVR